MTDCSRIFGLIGRPLGHSFSRDFFTRKFKTEGIDAEYLNFELPDIGDIMEVLAEQPRLCGLNVTIPYKTQVIEYLDEIDARARAIGAVNVVKVSHSADGEPYLKGYNSDVVGFAESLRPLLRPFHRHALILGTGGASKAVACALQELGITYKKVSRHKSAETLTYEELTPEVMERNLLIVNTTPLGMYPHTDECPDIPYSLLTPRHICYDVIYNPEETLFMKRAAAQGATVKNGLEMLHLQAEESWRIWNNP